MSQSIEMIIHRLCLFEMIVQQILIETIWLKNSLRLQNLRMKSTMGMQIAL